MQMKDKLKEGDVVVIILHDHGSRYVGKIYNDEWMKERGFLEEEIKTAKDILSTRTPEHRLISVLETEKLIDAIEKMTHHDISQMPVLNEKGEVVGSISEGSIYSHIIQNPEGKNREVKLLMDPPFPVVPGETNIQELTALLKQNRAVLIRSEKGLEIITKQDIIKTLC
jgi:cystathionine beta-synthase